MGCYTQRSWQGDAQAILGIMLESGAEFDAKEAQRALTRHVTLLRPQVLPEEALEAPTPFSDTSSRFSLSGGHRFALDFDPLMRLPGTCMQCQRASPMARCSLAGMNLLLRVGLLMSSQLEEPLR